MISIQNNLPPGNLTLPAGHICPVIDTILSETNALTLVKNFTKQNPNTILPFKKLTEQSSDYINFNLLQKKLHAVRVRPATKILTQTA